jgi:hypothetical protein
VALTGSGLVSPAIVDPGKIGKPAGTPSQIRPQAVSVCVSAAGLSAGALGAPADALGAPADALGAPEAAGLDANVGPPDGDGPGLCSAEPHAARSTTRARDRMDKRRRDRVDMRPSLGRGAGCDLPRE